MSSVKRRSKSRKITKSRSWKRTRKVLRSSFECVGEWLRFFLLVLSEKEIKSISQAFQVGRNSIFFFFIKGNLGSSCSFSFLLWSSFFFLSFSIFFCLVLVCLVLRFYFSISSLWFAFSLPWFSSFPSFNQPSSFPTFSSFSLPLLLCLPVAVSFVFLCVPPFPWTLLFVTNFLHANLVKSKI